MSVYRYRVFGLVIASDEPLPSLGPAELAIESTAATDVTVCHGAVARAPVVEKAGDLLVAIQDGGLYLCVNEVGRFAVASDRIVIEPEEYATPAEIQIYLLGSIMGALLYLRNQLPFHCNALEVSGKAFLFCGTSGAGKSTLAGFMEARGHCLLTDDMCALDLTGRVPVALPGIPRLKLWDDALMVLDRQRDERTPLPWHDHKWEVPISRGAQEAIPIGAIYHLLDDAEACAFRIEPLSGLAAINSIVSNIYRRRVGEFLGRGQSYLAAAAMLARTLPIFSVKREWSLATFNENALKIEEHMLARTD